VNVKPKFYHCVMYNFIDIAAALVGIACLGFWKPRWTSSVMEVIMRREFRKTKKNGC